MVDLSRVLGDVYSYSDEGAADRDPSSSGSTQVQESEAWADDARLDEAFRRWRPGPHVEPPATERMLTAPAPALDRDPDLVSAPQPVLPDDGDALATAYVPGTPAAAFGDLDALQAGAGPADAQAGALDHAVAEAFADAVAGETGRPRWSREQDDILPARRGRFGLRLRLR